jgi:2'-5' RNA ligase
MNRMVTVSAAAVLATVLAVHAPHAQPDSTRAGTATGATAEPAIRRGNLFSAVTFGDSSFGRQWARLRPEAETRFPDLKMTDQEALHITVVYIGGNWKTEDLGRIRALALVAPTAPVRFTPEAVPLGHNHQVVAVELHPSSSVWADSVVVAKAACNRLGLKKPEGYDTNFLTHITLAQARHTPPTAADSTALAGFLEWIREKIAAEPQRFVVTVGPATRVQLLLAGATRPKDAPEYVTVESFLEQQGAGRAK